MSNRCQPCLPSAKIWLGWTPMPISHSAEVQSRPQDLWDWLLGLCLLSLANSALSLIATKIYSHKEVSRGLNFLQHLGVTLLGQIKQSKKPETLFWNVLCLHGLRGFLPSPSPWMAQSCPRSCSPLFPPLSSVLTTSSQDKPTEFLSLFICSGSYLLPVVSWKRNPLTLMVGNPSTKIDYRGEILSHEFSCSPRIIP